MIYCTKVEHRMNFNFWSYKVHKKTFWRKRQSSAPNLFGRFVDILRRIFIFTNLWKKSLQDMYSEHNSVSINETTDINLSWFMTSKVAILWRWSRVMVIGYETYNLKIKAENYFISKRAVTIRREICPIRAEISTHKHGEKLYISYLYD